jgi:hypothetical protein
VQAVLRGTLEQISLEDLRRDETSMRTRLDPLTLAALANE